MLRFKSPVAPGLSLLLWATNGFGQVPVSYDLKAPARVSLAVYDQQGRQVRTLLSGARQKAGPHASTWDGLDWTGKPMPPGNYAWRLLESEGLKSEFLMRLGTSENYREWPANHSGPSSVVVEGNQAWMSGKGECVPDAVRVCLTNDAFVRYDQAIPAEAAIANGRLYALDGNRLTVANRKTGREVANHNLLRSIKRLDFQMEGGVVSPGWSPAPLAVYAKERGYGWDSIDGLRADTDAPGSTATLMDFHGPDPAGLAAELGADPCALYVFRVDVPKGRYRVELLMGTGAGPFDVDLYSGLKDGKPVFLRTEKFAEAVQDPGNGTGAPATLIRTIAIDATTTDNQLVFGFKSPKGATAYWTLRTLAVLAQPERVAARGPHLVVGYPANGTVLWLDTADSELKGLGSVQVEGLRDLDVLADGRVVVLTSTSLVEVARAAPPVVKATGITQAKILSVDQSNGDMLVWDDGQSIIRRFDPTCKPLATYGRAGGRQTGLYNPDDFLAVCSMASDNRGGFLVVENWSAPRRLAHFGSDGKLLREWCGGQLFFTGSAADTADPRRVWMNSHWGWIMEVEANYEARTWKTRSTYCLNRLAEGLVPDSGLINTWAVRHHGGRRYLVQGMPTVLLVDEENHRLLPMMVSGNWAEQIKRSKTVSTVLVKANRVKPPGWGSYSAFFWQDANGDGEPQEAEVHPSVVRLWGDWGGAWSVDEAMTFYHWKQDKDGFLLYRLPVKEWVGARPVYDNWDDVKPVRVPFDPGQFKTKKAWGGGGFNVAPDGGVYQQVQGCGENYLAGWWQSPAHSGTWPNNLIGESALCKWSPDKGGLEWRVGRLNTLYEANEPGAMNTPAGILGFAHGCVLFSGRVIQPMEAWTEDGLYAGAVFDRRADDGLPGAYYAWWMGTGLDGKPAPSPIQYDMFSGGSMVVQTNGDVLFFGTGWNNVLVYRVTGWDTFRRQSGPAVLKEKARAASGTGRGLYGEFFTSEAMTGDPARRRITPQLRLDYEGAWPKTAAGTEAGCVRWTGFIEARYSEAYRLKVYVDRGREIVEGAAKRRTPNDRVRIWLADKLIIDGWTNNAGTHLEARPVAFNAGEKVPVRIEYAKMGALGMIHFCWESPSQEIEHVPTACLYPPEGATADEEPKVARKGPDMEMLAPGPGTEPMPAELGRLMNELTKPGDAHPAEP